MGAYQGIFGEDVIVSGAIAIASDCVRRGETAYFTEVFETAVHLLVGHVWKRPTAREILILVLVQDGQCVFVDELPSTTKIGLLHTWEADCVCYTFCQCGK